ncbi:MAG: RluA family pseudouridine synthase [Bacteriovoracaceae bacterium]
MDNIDSPIEDSGDSEDLELTITSEDKAQFKRLDLLLTHKFPQFSRTFLKNLFEDGMITKEEEGSLSLNKVPAVGTKIIIDVPPPIPDQAIAENLPLDILYQDDDIIIVNKAAGMVTHPAPGNYTGTLVNAVLFHCPDLKGIGNVKRPGIVHRLDKGTSGVMVVAKSQAAHEKLVSMFSKHDLTRLYECITFMKPTLLSGKVDSTIGRSPNNRLKMGANVKNGKKSLTFYKVIKSFHHHAHIECKLETGRTHQIRVHMSQILHCPILGDETYGNISSHKKTAPEALKKILDIHPYPFLHAKVLKFNHPITGKLMDFEVPPPPLFREALAILESE